MKDDLKQFIKDCEDYIGKNEVHDDPYHKACVDISRVFKTRLELILSK